MEKVLYSRMVKMIRWQHLTEWSMCRLQTTYGENSLSIQL